MFDKIEGKNPGKILEEARISQNLTIDNASSILKIPAKLLLYIETGNYSNLPPEVYLRGIIKKYAAFLGLEPNKILEEYLEEFRKNIKCCTSGPLDILPENRFRAGKRYVLSFGTKELGILAGLIAFFYLVLQLSQFFIPPIIDLESPARDTIITNQAAFVVSGRLNNASRLAINGERIGIDPGGRFRYLIELEEGENIVELRASNFRGKTTTIIRKIIYQLN